MSRHVPLLTEAYLRAWAVDDPRVLTHLRAENQPGRGRRVVALTERARAAGWPKLSRNDRLKAATASVLRLEGVPYHWNGIEFHRMFQAAAYQSRSRREQVTVLYDDQVEDPVSIFDE